MSNRHNVASASPEVSNSQTQFHLGLLLTVVQFHCHGMWDFVLVGLSDLAGWDNSPATELPKTSTTKTHHQDPADDTAVRHLLLRLPSLVPALKVLRAG